MEKQELNAKLNKFFQDPDWILVEEMINDYIDPLRDVSTIDTNRPADAVMAEVAGRKLTVEKLTTFLRDARIIGQITRNKGGVSFK